MHLEDGDNFIPVTIVDNHGNEKKEKLKIRARLYEQIHTILT